MPTNTTTTLTLTPGQKAAATRRENKRRKALSERALKAWNTRRANAAQATK